MSERDRERKREKERERERERERVRMCVNDRFNRQRVVLKQLVLLINLFRRYCYKFS